MVLQVSRASMHNSRRNFNLSRRRPVRKQSLVQRGRPELFGRQFGLLSGLHPHVFDEGHHQKAVPQDSHTRSHDTPSCEGISRGELSFLV